MISVNSISKNFGKLKAVDDLTFDVNEGEIVGLLGPNGAGKSTTMRVMSGFLSPDKGDVIVDGFSVTKSPVEVKKMLGYLPENNPLYKDMLVSDLLDYSAKIKGVTEAQKQEMMDFVVNSVNIAEVYYRPISELSKGFKQRVGIALALLNRPKVLIMDEPTEGLDPNQRAEIRKLIKDLSKEHTIIISTHVMQEVEALCTRMVIINAGKKVLDGNVNELINNVKDERIISVKLEGSDAGKKLGELKGVKKVEQNDSADNTYEATIYVDKNIQLQPDISRLARENQWVIWELKEEVQLLEDLFKKLTQN